MHTYLRDKTLAEETIAPQCGDGGTLIIVGGDTGLIPASKGTGEV